MIPSRVKGGRSYVIRQPIGPVAAFSPWNFPATIPARKMGAGLASGCTMIFKPAEETPAKTLLLAQALIDAGLPDGVLQIVYGVPSEISTHLIASPIIRKGARLIVGGKRIPGGGYFFEPTVLADVPATADIMNEEPFGRVAVIAPFSTFEVRSGSAG